MIQWDETAKNGFKCFKMHSNTYSPKKCQQMATNFRKLQIITKFQKLLNMVKMTKIDKNVKQCKKNDKNGPKMP